MGTPRPIVEVENLQEKMRSWPNAGHMDYDNGARFSFRLGKLDGNWWRWPWPEWIGLPTRDDLPHWIQLVDGWRLFLMKPEEIDKVNEAMVRAVKML